MKAVTLVLAVVLTGCGGSSHHISTTPRAADFRILSSPGIETDITRVSDDGTTILGRDDNVNGPYLWTREGVPSQVPDTILTVASAFTPDGKALLGALNGVPNALLYTIGGDTQKLPLPEGVSGASTIDAGDSAILAHGSNANGVDQFFVVHDGKTTLLPRLSNQSPANASRISRKGFTVVGYSDNKAVRWTNLANPTPRVLTQTTGLASDVSDDGSVIVGAVQNGTGYVAFRWTESKGVLPLPLPTGATSSGAASVSGDGKVVIGSALFSLPQSAVRRPFVWTASTGSHLLEDLVDFSATPSGPMTNVDIDSISADGHTVVGDGTVVENGNPRIRGFVVTLP